MNTYATKTDDVKNRKWYLINAADKVLGRLSVKIVGLLTGKSKPIFTYNLDCGDYVVITNAGKIKITGNKINVKHEYRHSGYPGGDTYVPYTRLIKTDPAKIIFLAVRGMLPKNKLREGMLKRLKIYAEDRHPHQAQSLTEIEM